MFLSSLYCILCLGLSAYAISIASQLITVQISPVVGNDHTYLINYIVMTIEIIVIFPLTIYQNYQNYRKLSWVLISSILLSLALLII